ncbi:MAG: hypothetical protein SFW64_06340 [Alphaproteobacteria bacterium]|nr:hypothetical protein [Alphaproteobacteria bacterium]
MDESSTIAYQRPSLIASFMRGALSSGFNGVLMSGVMAVATVLLGIATLSSAFGAAPLVILTAALFGGVMAVKHTLSGPAHASTGPGFIPIPVPVQGINAPAVPTPALGQTISADIAEAPEQSGKNWAASVSQNGDTQSRIQQIITNGALSDKDRAGAILAAREANAGTDMARGA